MDAESDFHRARRHQVRSSLLARLRNVTGDVVAAMSFDDAVAALGRRGQRDLGTLVIPIDRIIGSVDKEKDFDREFRPTSDRSRQRWERIAEAHRRGEAMPAIDVYKLGDMYFVEDGHHRVSVARAMGLDLIEANVKEIDTAVSSEGVGGTSDLDRKHWRRVFFDRVPLLGDARKEITITAPYRYGILAEMVEAWATRTMFAEHVLMDRSSMARRWYDEEYVPVLDLIEEAGLRYDDETRADAYMRVAGERYDIIREHAWGLEVMRRIQQQSGKKRKRSTTKPAKPVKPAKTKAPKPPKDAEG
jgi:hypothetical protein